MCICMYMASTPTQIFWSQKLQISDSLCTIQDKTCGWVGAGWWKMGGRFEPTCWDLQTRKRFQVLVKLSFRLYESCRAYERVMSRAYVLGCVPCLHELCPTYVWVVSHICTSHNAHMSESENVFNEPNFCPWDSRLVPRNNVVLTKNPMRIQIHLVLNWKNKRNNLEILCHPKTILSAIGCTSLCFLFQCDCRHGSFVCATWVVWLARQLWQIWKQDWAVICGK